ncbi:triphosphoribosyl-dephospho-CoA synthase [Oxalobacteraceae bacterium A2-2]
MAALPIPDVQHGTRHETLAGRLADLAVSALVDEAMLTPKPGLVDMRGSGAHTDLNWLLMCHSAQTLRPYFRDMALAGQEALNQHALRARIGAIGREAERAMMAATGGVNTHRGAIWALGLLVTAAAQRGQAVDAHPRARHCGLRARGARGASAAPSHAHAVAERAGALARLPDAGAPASSGNKGELARKRYHVGGARAQAQLGFPHVTGVALPMLRQSRARGDAEYAAQLNALLAVIAGLDDTCLLARGGPAALVACQQGARGVLLAGGAATAAGKAALHGLEQHMLALGVSPGGAADLLAAALLLDRLEQPHLETSHGTTAL